MSIIKDREPIQLQAGIITSVELGQPMIVIPNFSHLEEKGDPPESDTVFTGRFRLPRFGLGEIQIKRDNVIDENTIIHGEFFFPAGEIIIPQFKITEAGYKDWIKHFPVWPSVFLEELTPEDLEAIQINMIYNGIENLNDFSRGKMESSHNYDNYEIWSEQWIDPKDKKPKIALLPPSLSVFKNLNFVIDAKY